MNTVRLRKLLLWLAGAIGLYALIGFLVVPAVVKRQTVAMVEKELAHKLELGEVRFNPFTLAAEIEGFSLAESTGGKLVSFKRLFVNLQTSGLFRGTWTFDAVELDGPDVRFELRPEGRHNFSALLDKLKKPSPEPDAPMPKIEIGSIRVNDGRLDVADLPAGNDARLTIQPLAFQLTDLSTLPSETSPYSLTARTVEGETLQWGGDITLNPFASTGKLSLQNWKMATLDRLLGNRIGLQSATGQIDIAIDYRAAFAQGQTSVHVSNAALTLADLSLVTTTGAAPLVGARKVSVAGGGFDLSQRTASIERIDVEGGSVSLAVAADGTPNWSALLPRPQTGPAAAATAPSPNDSAPPPASPTSTTSTTPTPWQFKLGRFEANDLAMSYEDRRAESALSLSLAQGRFGLAAALEAGPQGISGAISDLALATGAVSAARRGDRVGVQSIGLMLAAVKLNTASEPPQAGIEGLKLVVSGAAGSTGKQAVRIDSIDLAASSIELAIEKGMSAIAAVAVNAPSMEAKGLGAKSDSKNELVELKVLSVGAKQMRVALDQAADFQAEGIRASLASLVVREGDGTAIAARLGKLEASGGGASTSKRSVTFERIVLADGHASAAYAADGRLNWDRLIAQFVPSAPPSAATPAASANSWNIGAKLVDADNISATYADARQTPPLAVAVQDVRAKLRNVETSGKARAGIELSGRVKDSGQFRIAGSVEPTPLAADLMVKLDGISLLPAQPLLADYARLRLVSGVASAEGRLRYGKPKEAGAQILYEGNVGLDKLDLQESEPVQPFLALGSLRATQMKLSIGPNGLDIPDLRLNRLVTKLLIAEDQSINLLKVLRTGPSPAPTVQAAGTDSTPNKPAAAAPASEADEPFPVSIGRIRFDHSELEFADLSLRPQLFSTRMHELQGVITGVSTSRDSRARLELDARVDEFGAAIIRGSINPFRPRAYTEVDLDFRNIAMTSLSPYSTKFAGYRIASGQLSMNLQYRVRNSGLQGHNRIVLDNLQLGERVESATALNLPLEFAIAILKDSNGRIDIGLPVTGSLDDPQFSIAGLVWKAIGNLVTNIVTAPFRALASLFGGGQNEQLGAVEFDPGSAALRPPERQKLRTVAEALQKRPQLKLTIKPTFVAAADREALKSLAMRRTVLARAGIKLEPGESPGPLDVGNARMQQAIEALYTERFGLPAARDLRASLSKPAPDAQADAKPDPAAASGNPAARQAVRVARSMSNQLMEATEVPDTELSALGSRRAQAISAELQTSAKVEPNRVATEAPKAGEGKEGQIISELDLSVMK